MCSTQPSVFTIHWLWLTLNDRLVLVAATAAFGFLSPFLSSLTVCFFFLFWFVDWSFCLLLAILSFTWHGLMISTCFLLGKKCIHIWRWCQYFSSFCFSISLSRRCYWKWMKRLNYFCSWWISTFVNGRMSKLCCNERHRFCTNVFGFMWQWKTSGIDSW